MGAREVLRARAAPRLRGSGEKCVEEKGKSFFYTQKVGTRYCFRKGEVSMKITRKRIQVRVDRVPRQRGDADRREALFLYTERSGLCSTEG